MVRIVIWWWAEWRHCSGTWMPVEIHTHTHTNTVPDHDLCNEILIAVWAKVSTNRQLILVRVEEVVQVVDGHHQVCFVDQAGGSHAVVSGRPLSICTDTRTVNTKISEFSSTQNLLVAWNLTNERQKSLFEPWWFMLTDLLDWLQFTLYTISSASRFTYNSIIEMLTA